MSYHSIGRTATVAISKTPTAKTLTTTAQSRKISAFRSSLNLKTKILIAPIMGLVNALPVSSALKAQLKYSPATFFIDYYVGNVLGNALARQMLDAANKATGVKKIGGVRVSYVYGDLSIITALQLVMMTAKYPQTMMSLIRKKAGLAGYSPGNYVGCTPDGGLGCTFIGIDTVACVGLAIAIIGLIAAIAGPLLSIVGPMVGDFIGGMAPASAPPGGSLGPASADFQPPAGDGSSTSADEGPPMGLIVGGGIALSGVAWLLLRKKRK